MKSADKYRPFPPVELPDRRWPSRVLTHAPYWCSVDLRDGNQALIQPMSLDEKLEMFNLLVEVGFKEIGIRLNGSEIDLAFIANISLQNLRPGLFRID